MRDEARHELLDHVLPFYPRCAIDEAVGGFVGTIDKAGHPVAGASKGIVLNARLLWTFSRAHHRFGDATHLELARRARDQVVGPFWDARYGGVYSRLDAQAQPQARLKRTYEQGFALYGLAELFLASGDEVALERAIEIHRLLEDHSYDARRGGYLDTRNPRWTRGWKAKLTRSNLPWLSMNSHLHLMEAYTVLLAAWDDRRLRACQHRLVDVILDRFFDPSTNHFRQDFDGAWRPRSDEISYGHDLETCWLMVEAVEQLGDHPRRQEVLDVTLDVARTTLREGLDADGGIAHRGGVGGVTDREKIWWPQVEAVVGCLDAFERSGEALFLDGAVQVWQFAMDHLVDHDLGEWRFVVGPTKVPQFDVKIGPLKDPYHQGRACMEIIARADRMLGEQ